MIQIIIYTLLFLPLHGVITDLQKGKIKNYFIFPSLFAVIILSFCIEGFYTNIDVLISTGIVLCFSYLFYTSNKWGAGDGKYLILLGFSTIIIGYLKGIPGLILYLFSYTFGIFLIYTLIFLLKNTKKIPFKSLRKIHIEKLSTFSLSSLLFMMSAYIVSYLPRTYAFLIIFIIMMLILPRLSTYIKNRYIQYTIIIACFVFVYMNTLYIPYLVSIGIYIVFQIAGQIFDQIFDIIDTVEIRTIDLQQGSILTKKSRDKIYKDCKIIVEEKPLQGIETFTILEHYKKLDNKNEYFVIYKDVKLGVMLYIGYTIVLTQYVLMK